MIKQRLGDEIVRVQGNVSGGFGVSVGKKNKLSDFCNMDEKNFVSFMAQRRVESCAAVVLMYFRRFAFWLRLRAITAFEKESITIEESTSLSIGKT